MIAFEIRTLAGIKSEIIVIRRKRNIKLSMANLMTRIGLKSKVKSQKSKTRIPRILLS